MNKIPERYLDRIDDRVDSIDDKIVVTNLILAIGFILLILSVWVSSGKLNEPEIVEPKFITGEVERIGKYSVMVDGVVVNKICSTDLKLLKVGDNVLIEKNNWFSSCNRYGLTIQNQAIKVRGYNK